MRQLGLLDDLDRIKAFLVIDSDGGFTTGRLGEGTSTHQVCEAAGRLHPRLKPHERSVRSLVLRKTT